MADDTTIVDDNLMEGVDYGDSSSSSNWWDPTTWWSSDSTTADFGSSDVPDPVWDPEAPEESAKKTESWLSGLGSGIANTVKKAFTDSKGNINWGNVAAAGAGIASLVRGNQNKPVGYQGDIPAYTMVRNQVPQTYNPNRQPGSGGQVYFTDTQYTTSGNVPAAKENAVKQAEVLAAQNIANPAQQVRNPAWGYAEGGGIGFNTIDVGDDTLPYMPQNFARGGIANLAGGNYLAGGTDGMADKIPATIAGKQPAKLSHGEFVIPADVVSHLGNGNSEAGADRLYSMMDKIRQARTGTKKQGKQINPNKFLPG